MDIEATTHDMVLLSVNAKLNEQAASISGHRTAESLSGTGFHNKRKFLIRAGMLYRTGRSV
jgi:hypothetical protein